MAEAPTTLGARGVPVFAFPEPAVAALGRAAGYAAWRARPLGSRPDLPGIDRAEARAIVDRLLERGGGWQTASDAAAILACYDIQLTPAVRVSSKGEAVAAARALGYPVAVKADDPRLVHKTGTGAIRLGLDDAHAVRSAFTEVAALVEGDPDAAVAVQPMLDAGVETAAGIVHDPLFGSVVMFGLGGTATDVLADHAGRLAPLTERTVRELLTSPRCSPLLFGHAGAPAADLEALEQLLHRISRMACDLPQLAEADLNPLLAGPDGVMALDVRVRLEPRRPRAPYLRRLR
jgi:acyl-CoA synthetase (NDP forming)